MMEKYNHNRIYRKLDNLKINGFYLALILFALFILFRLPVLNSSLCNDEFYFYEISKNTINTYTTGDVNTSFYVMFFPGMIYKFFYTFFGQSIISLRLCSLIFSFLSVLIMWLLLKKNYSENSANLFLLFVTLNPWNILNSTRLDYDGVFLNFFFVLVFYFLLKYLRQNDDYSLYLIGFFIGFSICIKNVSGIILSFIVVTYLLFHWHTQKKDFRNIFNSITKLSIPLFIVLILYIILTLFIFGSLYNVQRMFYYMHVFNGYSGINAAMLLQFMITLLLLSPTIVGLSIFSFFSRKYSFFSYFLATFALFIIIFLIKHNYVTLERYASIMVLPLIAVCAIFLSDYIDFKKYFFKIIGLIMLFTLGLIIITEMFIQKNIINFYPKTAFLSNLIHIRLDFLVPFNFSIGPVGFYVSAFQLIIIYVISFLLLLLFYVILRHGKKSQLLLIFFISVSMVYSLIVVMEYDFAIQNYNIEKVNKEMIEFTKSLDNNQKFYIFRNDMGYKLESNLKNVTQFDFEDEYNDIKINKMIHSGSYIILLDFPQLNKNSLLWRSIINNCTLQRSFEDRKIELGYVFYCS